jgi:hypothetical protein
MTALNIPGVGEPVGQRLQRIMTFGASGESPDVSIGSGTGTTALININEPNVFVVGIEPQLVMKICTAGTGVVAMTIGDGTSVAGYWTDTALNVAATSAVFANMATSAVFSQGKLYTTSDTIDLVKGAAFASAGKMRLRITYVRNADTNLNPATSS